MSRDNTHQWGEFVEKEYVEKTRAYKITDKNESIHARPFSLNRITHKNQSIHARPVSLNKAQLFDNTTIDHSEYDYLEDYSHDEYITAWYNSLGYDHSHIKRIGDPYTKAVVDQVLANNKAPFPPIQKSPVKVETLEYSQLANEQPSTITSTVFSSDDNVHISVANYTTNTLGAGEYTEEIKYPEISFTTLTSPEDDHFQETDEYLQFSTHTNRNVIYIHSSGSEASINHPTTIEYDREEMMYWKNQVDESSENLGRVSARLIESLCNNKKKHHSNGEHSTHRERNLRSFNVENDQDNVLYLFIKPEDQLNGAEIKFVVKTLVGQQTN